MSTRRAPGCARIKRSQRVMSPRGAALRRCGAAALRLLPGGPRALAARPGTSADSPVITASASRGRGVLLFAPPPVSRRELGRAAVSRARPRPFTCTVDRDRHRAISHNSARRMCAPARTDPCSAEAPLREASGRLRRACRMHPSPASLRRTLEISGTIALHSARRRRRRSCAESESDLALELGFAHR